MTPSAPTIPEELIQQLHEATKRFQQARQELEHSMAASEYRHQERIDHAEDQLREAERELERLDDAIKTSLPPPPPRSP